MLVSNALLSYLTLGLGLHRSVVFGPTFRCNQKSMADIFEVRASVFPPTWLQLFSASLVYGCSSYLELTEIHRELTLNSVLWMQAYIGGLFREAGLRSTLFEARVWLDQVYSTAVFPHLEFRARRFIEASNLKEYHLVTRYQHPRRGGSSSTMAGSFSSSWSLASSSYGSEEGSNSMISQAPPSSPYLRRYEEERFTREGAVSPWGRRRDERDYVEEEGDWSFDREEEETQEEDPTGSPDDQSFFVGSLQLEMDDDASEVDMDRLLLPPSSATSLVPATISTTASHLPAASSTPDIKSHYSRHDSGYDSSTPLSLSANLQSPQDTPPPLPPPTPNPAESQPFIPSDSIPSNSQPFVLKPPAIRPSLYSSSTRPLRPSPLSQGQGSSTPSHSKVSTSSSTHQSTPFSQASRLSIPSRLAQVVHSSSPSRMSTPARHSTPTRLLTYSSSRAPISSTPQRSLVGRLDPTSQSPFKSTEPSINASPIQLQSLADEVFEQIRLLEEQEDEYEDMDLEDGSSDSGSDVEHQESLRLGDDDEDEEPEKGDEKKVAAPRPGFGFGFRSIVVHPKLAARAQEVAVKPRMKVFVDTPTGSPVKEGKPTEKGLVQDAVEQAAKRVAGIVGSKTVEVTKALEVVMVVDEEEKEEGEVVEEETLAVPVASASKLPSPTPSQFPPRPLPASHLPRSLPSKPISPTPSVSRHIPLASSDQPIASSSSSSSQLHRNPPPPAQPRSRSRFPYPSRDPSPEQDSYWSRRKDTLESFRRVGNSKGSSRERERERSPSPVRRLRSRSQSRSPERRAGRRLDGYQQEVRWRADQARERERREGDERSQGSRWRPDEREREREWERGYRGGYDRRDERRGGGGDGGERRRR